MTRMTVIAAAACALVLSLGVAGADPGAAGHAHAHKDAAVGAPGDPTKPARTVAVVMREGDGKMEFVPNRVEANKGEQIRFVLRNDGELDHEFVLATVEDNRKHAEAMAKHPAMEHDDPNAKRLAPNETRELLWRFTKAGAFEFACLIPGHLEAGMMGTVTVK